MFDKKKDKIIRFIIPISWIFFFVPIMFFNSV